MANIIKMIFGMCWDILGIEIQLYEYTITLRQVLLFAVLAYGVATIFTWSLTGLGEVANERLFLSAPVPMARMVSSSAGSGCR